MMFLQVKLSIFSLLVALLSFLVSSSAASSSGSFVDRTSSANVEYLQSVYTSGTSCIITDQQCLPDRLTGGAASSDFNNDGFPDLYVSVLDGPDILFKNNKNGTFSDVSASVGLNSPSHSNGVLWIDVDNDGDEDIFVTTIARSDETSINRYYLYINRINENGSFTEEAVARGVALNDGSEHVGMTAVAGDINLDGFLDIVTTQWTQRSITSHTRVFLNNGQGYFSDITSSTPLSQLSQELFFSAAFVDFNKDGWQDLLMIGDVSTSKLFWNVNGTLTASSNTQCCTEQNGHGVTFADINQDGYLDYFVSSISSTPTCSAPCGNRYYTYNPSSRTFTDQTDNLGVRHAFWGAGCAFFDANNDGYADLDVTCGANFTSPNNNTAYLNNPNQFFISSTQSSPLSENGFSLLSPLDFATGRSMVSFDYDQDGQQDIFIAHNGAGPSLYHNENVGTGGDWIIIEMVGVISNPRGIGAQVTVSLTTGQILYQEVGSQNNFLGHSPRQLHFGIGLAAVQSIDVFWPVTQLHTIINNPSSNSTVVATEPLYGFLVASVEANIVYTQATQLSISNCIFPSDNCFADRKTGGAAVADFNNDGYLDLYVTRLNSPGILFQNLQDGTFSDVTASVGLDTPIFNGNGALWCDINNDGLPDLFVTTLGSSSTTSSSANRFFLFINNGNAGFTEDAINRGLAQNDGTSRFGTSAACGDFNNDGHLDIVVAAYSVNSSTNTQSSARHTRLFVNNGSGNFSDVTNSQGLNNLNLAEMNLGVLFSDVNKDGFPDIIFAGDQKTSRFLKNNKGSFQDTTLSTLLTQSFNAHSVSVGDYNGDTYPDVFVSGVDDSGSSCAGTCGSHLYNGAASAPLTDVSDAKQVRNNNYGQGASFADFDNNGLLDLVVATGNNQLNASAVEQNNHDYFFLQLYNPSLGFYSVPSSVSGINSVNPATSAITFDYDNDGDLDLFVVVNGGQGILYRNDNQKNSNSWLRVKAIGVVSNAMGIGTQVTVQVNQNGPLLYREIGTSYSLQGHGDHNAHFGLGYMSPSSLIFQITVYWPAFNRVIVMNNVQPNQNLTVVEPLNASPSSTPTNLPSQSRTPATSPSSASTHAGTPSNLPSPSTSGSPFYPSTSPTPAASIFSCGYSLSGSATSMILSFPGFLPPRSVYKPADVLQTEIAAFLGVSQSSVVVEDINRKGAAVLICSSDNCAIASLANDINEHLLQFQGTILGNATVQSLLFGLVCPDSFTHGPYVASPSPTTTFTPPNFVTIKPLTAIPSGFFSSAPPTIQAQNSVLVLLTLVFSLAFFVH